MFNSKTVLIIGEDALMIYASSSGKAKRLGSLYWDEENLVERIAGFLLREGHKNPVEILYDMLEQQYKKETVPTMSVFDKGKYVDRKLKVVFPSNPMRAAYFLKGEAEDNLLNKKNANAEGTPYIFASIPDMWQMQTVYDAVLKSELKLLGIGLLPVEGASLIQKITAKTNKQEHKSKWAVLLSVHESGGLRQIVVKNGELALTRLTAVSSEASDAKGWGDEAGIEFKSTLSYLLRFGYSQDQSLNIYIVHGDSQVAEAFKQHIDIEPNIICETPQYFANMCGIKIKNGRQSVFGDGLHAAWATKKSGLKLPVKSSMYDAVVNTRKAYGYMTALIYILAFSGLIYASFIGKEIIGLNKTVSLEQLKHASLQNDLNQKKRSVPTIVEGVSFEKIINLLDVYDRLEGQGIQSFALIKVMGDALPSELKFSGLKVTVKENDDMQNANDMGFGAIYADVSSVGLDGKGNNMSVDQMSHSKEPAQPYEIAISLSFPDDMGVEKAVGLTEDYHQELVDRLQGYKVEIKAQAGNLSNKSEFTENLDATFINENAQKRDLTEDDVPVDVEDETQLQKLTATIIITGEGQ